MRRILFTCALLLVSALLPVLSARPASAVVNRDGCHGYVSHFYKSNGRVYLHAKVACSRAQGTIKVTAFLRRGDTWSRPTRTCTGTSFCVAVASLADHSGSQLYTGGPYSGWYPPATYARRGSTTMTCDNGMSCKLSGKYF